MNKTSVYLTEDETTRLAVLARREGTSQSEVIRRAIRSYEPQQRPDRDFVMAGVAMGPGGSVADIDPDELLDGFGA